MRRGITWITGATLLAALASTDGLAGEESKGRAGLRAEIDSLRVPDVAWRKIPWKTCLIDGLAASRKQQKPVMLWIFIDRPVDDARC